MSHAAIWSGRRNNIRLMLPCVLLVAVLVAMAPQSLASDSKSSAKAAAPAPHPAAPAPHANTYPGANQPGATGSRPPSSNGVYQRPPSSNGTSRPPSSNGTSRPPSTNGTSQRPPSSNGMSTRPPSSASGGPPHNSGLATTNKSVPNSANAGSPHNTGNPGAPGPQRTVTSLNGRQVSVLDHNGHPTMTRVQGTDGSLRTTQRLSSGTRMVQTETNVHGVGVVRTTSFSANRGVVERPVYGHACCIRRSYLVGPRSYAVVYRGYAYRGFAYYRPVPAYVYGPAFYAWTVQPWGPPVVYVWGWGGQPWYAAYGGVFTPYPAYSNLDGWMTDYVISSNLQQAYAAGQADGMNAAQAQAPPPQITPEMKQQIANQVEDDLKNQQQQAQTAEAASQPGANVAQVTETPGDVPEALQDGHVLFRVVDPLSVKADGQECVLNTDDWVTRTSGVDTEGMVKVQVKASREADCRQGAKTEVALNDLMVMEGDFEQQVRNGVQYASKNLGKNGLPQGPDPGAAPVSLGTAVADANLSNSLKQQQQAADGDERQAMASSSAQGGTF